MRALYSVCEYRHNPPPSPPYPHPPSGGLARRSCATSASRSSLAFPSVPPSLGLLLPPTSLGTPSPPQQSRSAPSSLTTLMVSDLVSLCASLPSRVVISRLVALWLERFSILLGCLMQCNLTHVSNLEFLVLGGWIKILVAAVMVMGNPNICSVKSNGLMVILLHLARFTANTSFLTVYPKLMLI
jgi:hypothetical protein